MRKTRVFILTLVLICASVMAVSATNYKESESNDYMGQATSISIASGNTFSGSFSSKEDVDWYKIKINKGSVISLELRSVGSLESTGSRFNVEIYDSNHTDSIEDYFHLYKVKYNSNLGYLFEKEKLYLGTGTYYLKFKSDYYPFSYRVSITGVNAWETIKEPNDTIPKAIGMTSGTVYKGIFASYSEGEDTDYDFFKFNSSAGGKYYVTFKNVDVPNNYSLASVTAYDRYGDEVYLFGDYPFISAEEGKTTSKLVTLPVGYTYFKVSPSHYSPYGNGRYKFSVTKKPAKTTGVSLEKSGTNYTRIYWTPKTNVTGYKIYRSTSKNSGYKLIKTVSNTSTDSYLDKGTKKGKKYYYRVRSYKTVNGKYCFGYYSVKKYIKR